VETIHYRIPNSRDEGSLGSIFYYVDKSNRKHTYIQTNEDTNNPNWESMSSILESALSPLKTDFEFLQFCVEMSESHTKRYVVDKKKHNKNMLKKLSVILCMNE